MTKTSIVFEHPHLNVVWADSIRSWVEDRADRQHLVPDPSYRAAIEIALLHDLLALELREQTWTLLETEMLAASLVGVIPDLRQVPVHKPPRVWHEVRGSLADHNDDATEHTEDEVALLARLAELGPAAEHALVDAISRWLNESQDHSDEGWAAVVVRIVDPPEASPSGR